MNLAEQGWSGPKAYRMHDGQLQGLFIRQGGSGNCRWLAIPCEQKNGPEAEKRRKIERKAVA